MTASLLTHYRHWSHFRHYVQLFCSFVLPPDFNKTMWNFHCFLTVVLAYDARLDVELMAPRIMKFRVSVILPSTHAP